MVWLSKGGMEIASPCHGISLHGHRPAVICYKLYNETLTVSVFVPWTMLVDPAHESSQNPETTENSEITERGNARSMIACSEGASPLEVSGSDLLIFPGFRSP